MSCPACQQQLTTVSFSRRTQETFTPEFTAETVVPGGRVLYGDGPGSFVAQCKTCRTVWVGRVKSGGDPRDAAGPPEIEVLDAEILLPESKDYTLAVQPALETARLWTPTGSRLSTGMAFHFLRQALAVSGDEFRSFREAGGQLAQPLGRELDAWLKRQSPAAHAAVVQRTRPPGHALLLETAAGDQLLHTAFTDARTCVCLHGSAETGWRMTAFDLAARRTLWQVTGLPEPFRRNTHTAPVFAAGGYIVSLHQVSADYEARTPRVAPELLRLWDMAGNLLQERRLHWTCREAETKPWGQARIVHTCRVSIAGGLLWLAEDAHALALEIHTGAVVLDIDLGQGQYFSGYCLQLHEDLYVLHLLHGIALVDAAGKIVGLHTARKPAVWTGDSGICLSYSGDFFTEAGHFKPVPETVALAAVPLMVGDLFCLPCREPEQVYFLDENMDVVAQDAFACVDSLCGEEWERVQVPVAVEGGCMVPGGQQVAWYGVDGHRVGETDLDGLLLRTETADGRHVLLVTHRAEQADPPYGVRVLRGDGSLRALALLYGAEGLGWGFMGDLVWAEADDEAPLRIFTANLLD